MPRIPRVWTRQDAIVEIVNRTLQGRHLIKPSPFFNAIIIGALAKAQQKHGVEIYCGAFANNHFHLLLKAESVRAQAGFMRDFTRKLSIESGIAYDWQGTTFPERYRSTEVSAEPEAQIERLTYLLQHGTKENLVASPSEWPGVQFCNALTSGEALKGIWINRSAYYRAKQRGKDVTLDDFTEHLELKLSPLPCWCDLDHETRQELVKGIVRQIEQETALRHTREKTEPLGIAAVLGGDPHFRPKQLRTPPKPYVHAASRRVRREMREALSLVVSAYSQAASRLRAGDFSVRFPENTFPSRLPFVEPSATPVWMPG